MKTINLRDYYLHYKEDEFYEVPDAIADLLREFERKEKNCIRKIKRYRAYFSLDVGDKIESETLLSQNDPADILELRKVTPKSLTMEKQYKAEIADTKKRKKKVEAELETLKKSQ